MGRDQISRDSWQQKCPVRSPIKYPDLKFDQKMSGMTFKELRGRQPTE